jgi:fibronectin-binding autotransporter adhesin
VQLSVTNNISGSGGITLSNTAGCALSVAGSSNTFSGGFTLTPGARVIVAGNTNASGAGGVPTASYLGVGPLVINGGSISNTLGYGLNQGLANSSIFVNADFNMNLAARMMFGGAWNLGGGTRNVTTLRAVTSTNAVIAGGNTTWGLGTVSTVTSSVTNGTLRVSRDPAAANPYVSFRLASNPTFFNNAGLTLGSGVLATIGNGDLTNASPANLVTLTLESGSVLALGETAVSRNATVSSLAGGGLVANLNNTATPGTYLATLTINGGALTGASDFSGRIVDVDTNVTGASVWGTTAFAKLGATTQILSGSNSYTGPTFVGGGALRINGNQSAATGPVTVNGATLSGHGSVGGLVVVTNGGALQPGNNLPGRLTLATNLTLNNGSRLVLEIGGLTSPAPFQSGSTNHDLIIAGGNVTLGGGLFVSLVNAFTPAATDNFVVVTNLGTLSGSFTNLINGRVAVTNLPGGSFQVVTTANSVILTNYQVLQAAFTATPTNGLAPLNVAFTDLSTGAITNRFWDFGDGFTTNSTATSIAHTYTVASTNLVRLVVTDGLTDSTNSLVIVVSVISQPPLISGVNVAGTNLVLVGTNGTAGTDCFVLAATNLTLPLTNWAVIATNQFDINGTFRYTNPISPVVPRQFFRLQLP